MNKDQAVNKLLDFLEKGSVVKSVIEEEDKFLFIAHRSDLDEGKFDPFFSLDKKTGLIRDFSPQDYPEPLAIIKKLQVVYKE
ncbi:MAG: hypothetical protein H0U49_05760 [Parachlamydiaceae bacterium]|nr:hypothetical protein [Parachlamydiaceae bacterium]